MKRIIKNIIFLLIIMIIFINFNNIVYASSFKFEVEEDENIVKPGDIINIEVKVSEIDIGELGINTIEGFLEYDEEVFEVVTQEDMSGQNGWMIAYNSGEGERKGKFLFVLLENGLRKDRIIGNIKLKVKSEAKPGETIIKFTNILTNDEVNLISDTDKEIKITIEEEEIITPTPTPTPTPTLTPGITTGNMTINDTAPGKIPQAGKEKSVILIASVSIIAIAAAAIYLKYKNIDK